MAEREVIRERVITDDTAATRVATEDATAAPEPARNSAARLVYWIAGVLVGLLAFRFILSLLGANRGNAFADLIYSLTYPFVAPFFGLFGYRVQYGVARFEFETLIAMLVYWLLAVAIVKLLFVPRRRTTA